MLLYIAPAHLFWPFQTIQKCIARVVGRFPIVQSMDKSTCAFYNVDRSCQRGFRMVVVICNCNTSIQELLFFFSKVRMIECFAGWKRHFVVFLAYIYLIVDILFFYHPFTFLSILELSVSNIYSSNALSLAVFLEFQTWNLRHGEIRGHEWASVIYLL